MLKSGRVLNGLIPGQKILTSPILDALMSGYITEIHLCIEVKAFHQLVNLPLEVVYS